MTKIELAAEIQEFLSKHAGIRPDYVAGEEDPEERFTSPDASCMSAAAHFLNEGLDLRAVPWSSWSSGGYKPYVDNEARAWHDRLKEECKQFVGVNKL